MTAQAPKIDNRTYQDVVAQTEQLVKDLTPWEPRADGKLDAGGALIGVFGRMAELVIERLNQALDKNFLAFLDLIGTPILPPQPARAPLTFLLATGAKEQMLAPVPARTQAAAQPQAGEKEEIIFETDQDLMLTAATLKAVFVHDPSTDRFSDYTDRAANLAAPAFPAFAADEPIEHSLYLAWDEVLLLPGRKVLTLVFEGPGAAQLASLPITWSTWDGEQWQPLAQPPVTSSVPTGDDKWQVVIDSISTPGLCKINGIEAGWLKAKSDVEWLPTSVMPQITKIAAQLKITNANLIPDQAFANTPAIDLSKDFFPFGEKPRFNDTFYLGSQEVFGKAGAEQVSLSITLSESLTDKEPNASEDLEIVWEFWDCQAWRPLGRSKKGVPSSGTSNFQFNDATEAFTKAGQVTFALPEALKPGAVNGETNYWVRARIIRGNYGTEATYQEIPDGQGKTTYKPVPATFGPPSVATMCLGYTYQRAGALARCLAQNDFSYVDVIAEVKQTEAPVAPFRPSMDTDPTLYLGYDQPFANRTVHLFALVEPPVYDDDSGLSAKAVEPARVTWEYSTLSGWRPLRVQDETRAFTRPGLITFIGPQDLVAHSEFGQSRCWLRVRWQGGSYAAPPRLRGVLTNTTWASHATSIRNEVLGSSTGEPGQIFTTARKPVLLGPQIEIRELVLPSDAERPIIEREEGQDAIARAETATNQAQTPNGGVWVRWHKVPDFYGSGPRDRHYVLDHLTGDVRFGDGQQGMAPPQGRSNVRAALYRTGGGRQGNLSAGSIAQLKTTIPYVSAVTNHDIAAGGADQESLDKVRERGPKALRHRQRAVAGQDFEDLALEASSEVARARVIPAGLLTQNHAVAGSTCPPGQVGLIIVPHSAASPPKPSLELIERVRSYLLARCLPGVDVQALGPRWVEVAVEAEIVPNSFQAAFVLEAAIVEALERFLHPLTGGPAGMGWAFGRWPHDSDLYALLESIEGVDHVQSLTVQSALYTTPGSQLDDSFLIYSGAHKITLVEPVEEA